MNHKTASILLSLAGFQAAALMVPPRLYLPPSSAQVEPLMGPQSQNPFLKPVMRRGGQNFQMPFQSPFQQHGQSMPSIYGPQMGGHQAVQAALMSRMGNYLLPNPAVSERTAGRSSMDATSYWMPQTSHVDSIKMDLRPKFEMNPFMALEEDRRVIHQKLLEHYGISTSQGAL